VRDVVQHLKWTDSVASFCCHKCRSFLLPQLAQNWSFSFPLYLLSPCLTLLVFSQPLVQFKAGKCNLAAQEDGSFLVTPDLKKGKISLHKGADGLIHFKWTDRSSNTVVSDLLVFPDEVVFKKVVTGTPTDRVYMLKWKIGDRREMFWLQDKRTDNDSENCEKINRFINNPDATNQPSESDNLVRMLRGGRPAARGATPAVPAATAPASRHSNAFGLDLGRIIQGIQAPAPAAPAATAPETTLPQAPPAAAAAASSSQPLLSADALRQAMAGMTLPPPATERPPPTDINRVLSPDAIIATGVLNDPQGNLHIPPVISPCLTVSSATKSPGAVA
jgi:hypothetical protein